MMAEFDYGQTPFRSFLVDPTRERWSMWLVKTRLLPWGSITGPGPWRSHREAGGAPCDWRLRA